jgi:hypothetical protein
MRGACKQCFHEWGMHFDMRRRLEFTAIGREFTVLSEEFQS